MFDQLQASKGQKVVIELVNGRQISGSVVEVNQQIIRLETEEGIGTIPISAVLIVWENLNRSLTEKNMQDIANELRSVLDETKARLACTGIQGFSCGGNYICRPPDYCSFSFECPGRYTPGPGLPPGQCTVGFVCPAQFYGYQPGQVQMPCGQPFHQYGCLYPFQPCYYPFQPGFPPGYPPPGQCTVGYVCPAQFYGFVGPTQVTGQTQAPTKVEEQSKDQKEIKE